MPEFELMLAELSAGFINLAPHAVDDAIRDALRRIVTALDADRAQLVDFKLPNAWVTHSWAVEGVPSVPRKIVGDLYPWIFGQLVRGEAVVAPRVAELPAHADVDKASFARAGVKSNLSVPMSVGGRVVGAITFGCLRAERSWPPHVVTRARVLAEVFANALAHKRAQETLDAALRFERLVSDVLGMFLTVRSIDDDLVIEEALRKAADVLRAERATLWTRVGNKAEFRETHRWAADSRDAPASIPWIGAQLAAGAVVRFDEAHSLPHEARDDLRALHAVGVRSGVFVPLAVSGDVVGALSIAGIREEREWPASLVPRIRHLGEVFAAALSRTAAERREQEARAQAIHAERVGTMGAFTASLAHELTQPLSAIESNAQTAARLLELPKPDVEEVRAALQDILADERRAAGLVQKLRVYMRKGHEERRVLDLHDAVEEAARFVRSTALERGVDLVLAIPQDVNVAGDAVQIQQVVVNVLLNAFDAVMPKPPGARIVAVTARREDAAAVIEVRDSGVGMDAPTLAKMFQPFFTTKASGMGLGLAISRSIAESHGGSLSAASTHGTGTTVRLALPMADDA